ncbi:MAG: tyrosine--tRNA ligase [Phycisphaerales bacterium]|nr:tyrosine--tRNA ligase [Phycisphaerales bacterium]
MMSDLGLSELLRGCEHVYTDAELRHKLESAARQKRQLRIKLGMDPTAPDVHLGHSVVLSKMRQFQDLGHRAVLIIGDFTTRIGDPTGRSKTRPVLSDEEIERNSQTYFDQVGKILDMSPEKLEIRRNSEWLGGMTFADVVRLAARMTVGQLLKREDFRNRYEAETPISLHELLYPLVQGWDSVNICADVELGGTDQTYNNLVGRELQSQVGQEPQVVLVMPLLRGTDGVKKMSKSLGNYVGVFDSATDVYGKTMAIPDALLPEWYRLLTDMPESNWKAAIAEHPMKAKGNLAKIVGAKLRSREEMDRAAEWWHARFSQRKTGERVVVAIPAAELTEGAMPAWKLFWLAHEQEISKTEARRMVQNGAFEVGDRKIEDPNETIAVLDGLEFRAGRHRKGERIKQPLECVAKL